MARRVALGHAGGDTRSVEVDGLNVLGLDTATPATVAGVLRADGERASSAVTTRAPGERPGHAAGCCRSSSEALAGAGLGWDD